MTIGIDVREFAEGAYTGIGRFLRNFLLYAAESLTGDRFVLYGDAATHPPETPPHIVFKRLPGSWPFFDHFRLPRELSNDQIDVFFSPYYKAPWRCPCPYVITIHDLMFLRVRDGGRREAMKRRAWMLALRKFVKDASGVITDSEYSKRDIDRRLGLPMDKAQVIPLSLAPQFAPADENRKASARNRYGLPENCVLYVGNFKPHKNVPALLKAFAALPATARQKYPLFLAGPQDASYRLFEKDAADMIRASGARLLPPVPEGDLPAFYSCASVCVMPSLEEGFGLPALEAMACGVPVIASNRASIPEVVGDAGLLSEPDAESLAKTLERLLGDERLRETLSQKGAARARQFSYPVIGRQIYSYLTRCAGGLA